MTEAKDQATEAQQTFFRITDNVPEEAWYWAALGSIGISAMLKLAGKDGPGHRHPLRAGPRRHATDRGSEGERAFASVLHHVMATWQQHREADTSPL
jgi:hypothetical protein